MAAPAPTRTRRQPFATPPATSAVGDDDLSRDPFMQRLTRTACEAKRMRESRRDIIEGLKYLDEQRLKAERADAMYEGNVGMVYASHQVRKLLANGALCAAVIGEIVPKRDKALWVK